MHPIHDNNASQHSDERYNIGIDAGSKTIKLCVSDQAGTLAYSAYRRHRSDIRSTLTDLIHDFNWRFGPITGTIAITGSAGIGVAEALGIDFVQEVVATTLMVKTQYPQADAVIELGGEDAKIIYLTNGLEQRMNATCAGGTGGFIDTIAYMLGVRTKEISTLAMGASRVYPIASRCAVFAQTDMRPLMNAGAKTNDLAASALDAVVRQTIGGLACGRPISGNVVFLGGPCEHIPDLVTRFRKALNLNNSTGIKPIDAHLFTARGAGLYSTTLADPTTVSTLELESRIKTIDFTDESLQHLEPLFTSEEEVEAFKERLARNAITRGRLFHHTGPAYLGIDAGSTTVKLALIDDEGALLYGAYQENEGDALKTAAAMLADMYREFPRDYKKAARMHVAHATATGYGEDMLIAGLGVDSGVVETTAHVQAALQFAPDASFVLDIGGQDMKAIWVKDGLVQNAVLNEACSSGCGSFISGTAYTLHMSKETFANVALLSKKPVDLGTKCTVFMNSRLKHAQKTGALPADLAAGCAYSVVKNALFRIIGINNIDSLGEKIVVQGGTFMNDAVVRAFEKISGKTVVRPNRANLMGAIGAALVARSRAFAQAEPARSTLISKDELEKFNPKRSSRTCEGCPNACTLSIVSFGDERTYIGGNRCGTAWTLYAKGQQEHESTAPNALAAQRALLKRYTDAQGSEERGKICVGLLNVLLTYEFIPFWHTFLSSLGLSVMLAHDDVLKARQNSTAGSDTIPSESVCHPAKYAHKRLKALSIQGATHAFMPYYERGINCPVSAEYVEALADGASISEPLAKHLITPSLHTANPFKLVRNDQAKAELLRCLNKAFAENDVEITAEELESAFQRALEEQQRHTDSIRAVNEHILQWLEEDENRHGVLLAGRPYHVDDDIAPEIDQVLAKLGLAVLSPTPIDRNDAPRIAESDPTWRRCSRMMRLAGYVAAHPQLEMVNLQSFGCLYDSINTEQVGAYLQSKGKLFVALKIDEITDTAHLRIRLRTLAENIEQSTLARNGARTLPTSAQTEPQGIRVFQTIEPSFARLAHEGSLDAFSNMNSADIETARTHTHDICFSSAALIGRALRLLAADESLTSLTIPHICADCVLDAVPSILMKVSNRPLSITWEDDYPSFTQASLFSLDAARSCNKPLVGILGTSALCFDNYLNDNLVELVQVQGCQPVLPSKDALFCENVQYLDQLQRFYEAGVRHVIYLQSFGCLKGHVHARGSLHELNRLFPKMNITVLDYDQEASALNRENRVLLALASAREDFEETH